MRAFVEPFFKERSAVLTPNLNNLTHGLAIDFLDLRGLGRLDYLDSWLCWGRRLLLLLPLSL